MRAFAVYKMKGQGPEGFRCAFYGKRPTAGNEGFTLLELLISLTILALIVVVVFSSLRIGIRAWEKGEKAVESNQRQRVVLSLVEQQIASICVPEKDERNSKFFFNGDQKSLEFVSQVSVLPDNSYGMVYAKYVVRPEGDRECWLICEKNTVMLDWENFREDIDEEDFEALFCPVLSVEFSYLKPPAEGEEDYESESRWQDTWDMETEQEFPQAVRIVLFNEDKFPLTAVARIRHDEL